MKYYVYFNFLSHSEFYELFDGIVANCDSEDIHNAMLIPRIPEIVCENFYRKDDFVNAFLTPEETVVIDDDYAGIVVNTVNYNRLIIPA